MGKLRFKKLGAMSLLSLLVVLAMIVVMIAAATPMITQNLIKISKGKKKTGEVSLAGASGYFICYYDVDNSGNNVLAYKQVEIESNGDVREIGSGKNVTECKFEIPDAEAFEIMLVGGGGGGASSTVKNEPYRNVALENIGFIGGTITFSSSYFREYNEFIDRSNVQTAINKLIGGQTLFNIRKSGGASNDNACSKTYGGNIGNPQLQLSDDNSYIKFEVLSTGGTGKVLKKNNEEECIVAEGSCPDSRCGNGGILSEYGDYAIIDAFSGKIIVSEKDPIKLQLTSFATEVKKGNAGAPGQFITYKIHNISDCDGKNGNTCHFNGNNIGKGGEGGKLNKDNGVGGNGEDTKIKINGSNMVARGGSGGQIVENTNFLDKVKIEERGDNGEKSLFYIPSQLRIDETSLGVGFSSKCTKGGCEPIRNSRYPGSSGASSGYNIGVDNFAIEIDGRGYSFNKNDFVTIKAQNNSVEKCLYSGVGTCDGIENHVPENDKVKTQDAGSGANGAILIKW